MTIMAALLLGMNGSSARTPRSTSPWWTSSKVHQRSALLPIGPAAPVPSGSSMHQGRGRGRHCLEPAGVMRSSEGGGSVPKTLPASRVAWQGHGPRCMGRSAALGVPRVPPTRKVAPRLLQTDPSSCCTHWSQVPVKSCPRSSLKICQVGNKKCLGAVSPPSIPPGGLAVAS